MKEFIQKNAEEKYNYELCRRKEEEKEITEDDFFDNDRDYEKKHVHEKQSCVQHFIFRKREDCSIDDVAEARQKKRKNKKIGLRFSFSVIAVFVFENLKHCKSHDNKKKHRLDQRLKNIIVAHLVIRDKLTRQIQAKKI